MPQDAKVSLAVMGDSNSLSYQDRISNPNPEQRGGALRDRTLQWGEVIARLRADEIDQGPWEISGESNPRLRWFDSLRLPVARAPRKEDFRFNFANESASCTQLMTTRVRQAPRLVALMDREPQRWESGVVVIRIGIADLSGLMETQARSPGEPAAQAVVQGCVQRYREAVDLIRRTHPGTHIVLVDSFEDSNDAHNLDRWQSAAEIRNIARVFDDFDEGLRAIVAEVPHTSFFDDRAWFRGLWGSRDAQGRPAFRTVSVGALQVTHSVGDEPTHSLLADDHNGLVWNVLWAQAMVRHLHEVAGLPVTPISDEEVERLVRSLTTSDAAR
ncbi:SGNH/GDSL hydrolase family protein [Variovorax sp. OV329]|uniref:SGNH/GDSL hydrolase family protein n=1 Tax=Variovorax sp. OV329 TaxID=1882825 RepID=UPI0008EF974A|nr:SGNH/GDSL hydrolase family protein [Variovorax sp. OV329]SFL87867.1 hypothetical protein SAMN05444747_10198 [Variovorax sp. OV329]